MKTTDKFMNTSETTTTQTPDNGKLAHLPTRTTPQRRGKRLCLADARDVAALCAKRANEGEACAVLGIPYSTWMHWKAKARNSEQFREIIDSIKGAKIKAHLDNIESFSAKDWRASECYLEKTIPDRFSNKAATVEITNNAPSILQLVGGEEALRKLIGQYSKKPTVEIDATVEPKQIENSPMQDVQPNDKKTHHV